MNSADSNRRDNNPPRDTTASSNNRRARPDGLRLYRSPQDHSLGSSQSSGSQSFNHRPNFLTEARRPGSQPQPPQRQLQSPVERNGERNEEMQRESNASTATSTWKSPSSSNRAGQPVQAFNPMNPFYATSPTRQLNPVNPRDSTARKTIAANSEKNEANSTGQVALPAQQEQAALVSQPPQLAAVGQSSDAATTVTQLQSLFPNVDRQTVERCLTAANGNMTQTIQFVLGAGPVAPSPSATSPSVGFNQKRQLGLPRIPDASISSGTAQPRSYTSHFDSNSQSNSQPRSNSNSATQAKREEDAEMDVDEDPVVPGAYPGHVDRGQHDEKRKQPEFPTRIQYPSPSHLVPQYHPHSKSQDELDGKGTHTTSKRHAPYYGHSRPSRLRESTDTSFRAHLVSRIDTDNSSTSSSATNLHHRATSMSTSTIATSATSATSVNASSTSVNSRKTPSIITDDDRNNGYDTGDDDQDQDYKTNKDIATLQAIFPDIDASLFTDYLETFAGNLEEIVAFLTAEADRMPGPGDIDDSDSDEDMQMGVIAPAPQVPAIAPAFQVPAIAPAFQVPAKAANAINLFGAIPAPAPRLRLGAARAPPAARQFEEVQFVPPVVHQAAVPYLVNANVRQKCLGCQEDAAVEDLFCSRQCAAKCLKKSPLVKLPDNHSVLKEVTQQFNREWRHPTAKPKIVYVYAIISSEATTNLYLNYRDSVEKKRNCVAKGQKPGNEELRWHGTLRQCFLGDKNQLKLCKKPQCCLCNIIRSSFDINKFGKRWGRFGRGIYSSATSSKAHDYTKNRKKSFFRSASPLTALLLNNVVVGNGKSLLRNSSNLQAPPNGFDSVLGEPGADLNYDETVIYTNSAIRPAFLVMYA